MIYGISVIVREPILLMGFNRPELMSRVLDRIRDAQPEVLYVAVDGPRSDQPGEADLVRRCRDLVTAVDWECRIETLFQEENLGCGVGVSTAISWFFSHEERGIILEDDVVPEPSFFGFCTELLDRYEFDDRVFAISGCNVVPGNQISDPAQPYRFSRIPMVWGWATWRRSWQRHRLDIRDWRTRLPVRQLLQRCSYSPSSAAFWATEFELTSRGDVDTWDWQLTLAALASDQLTATSNTNLVSNIGFGADATHTMQHPPRQMEPCDIDLPVPAVPVVVDTTADRWATRHHFGGPLLTTLDRIRKFRRRSAS